MTRIPYLFLNFYYSIIGFVLMRVKYKNVWNLKLSYQQKPTELKKVLYYRLFESVYKGSWIGINSKIESTPKFPHGINGIFISDKAVIGQNVIIFHQVTIGSNTIRRSKTFGSPTIGDNVYIGCGAKIIGGIRVEENSRIGANAVVVKDIPANATVMMDEPRVLVKTERMNNEFLSVDRL